VPSPPPNGLTVRLPFATAEQFLRRYGPNVSKGGIFLRSKQLKAPGTALVLEVKLEGGERLLYASAVVAYVSGHTGEGIAGMGFRFITLDRPSRQLLESLAVIMPHAKSDEAPVPNGIGPISRDTSAIAEAPPAPAQAQVALPSEKAGQLLVASTEAVSAPEFVPAPAATRTGPIIGIDLGTTNSCAAIVRNGKPQILRSRDGVALIPSIVALTPRGKLVVGGAAKAQLSTNPRLTVQGFKRLLGRAYDSVEVQQLTTRFAWEVAPTDTGDCGVQLGDKRYPLEQISALVLMEVKQLAEQRLGHTVNRAVITVPAWYTEKQRQLVREAGRMAGLIVERIVNEPTAAALAYGYGKKLSQRVLVYDLGGGTFDASVLELSDTVYEVMSTGGDPFLGGMDFDHAIVSWLLKTFQTTYDTLFTDRIALQRVVQAAESAKIALSTSTEYRLSVPFVTLVKGQPVDLSATLTRTKLTELTRELVDRTMAVCQTILASQRVSAHHVDELLLVGGQSKAPLVQERVTLLFGKQPVVGPNPEEAVALGAAQLAHSLETKEGLVLIDVLPMTIGIGLPGGRFHPVVAGNSALPATKKHLLTARSEREAINFSVFQGESALVKDNTYLGHFRVTGVDTAAPVELSFEVNNECLLTISAKVASTGQTVTSTFATKDTPAQVRARLAELEAMSAPPAKGGLWSWVRELFA
jgi:molecular chaperone DnaK